MKKIINGVRFDTDKASAVGRWNHSHPSQLEYISETLYKTPRSGRYFVAGEGNALSRYAEQIEVNAWGRGSRIIPLDDEAEAFQWAQKHLTTAEVEEHFGHMIEEA